MKLLVVEDDRKLARFLRRVLSEDGYAVDVSASGGEALERARTGVYKLLVLDWMLPDVDGLEVCRRLRQTGSALCILMLTARGDPAERVIALDAGADDCLAKPFEVDELGARVRALLRRAGYRASLKLGALTIDRDQQRALVGGTPVDLAAREFAVLMHLAHHVGAVVTREQLVAEVWSSDTDPESNVVDVQMSRLRDKLGEAGAMIETVRGRGYRLRLR